MKVMTNRPGRPREFDIAVATRNAMEVFWQKGFHATSLPDLIEGMGLTRGSIYKAYEDKRSIYLAALDAYIEERLARFEKDLAKANKRIAIRDALRRIARLQSSNEGRKGCFITAATVEMVPTDPDVEERVADLYRTLEELLANAIDDGKADGTISSKVATANLAKFLVLTIEGICVMGKLGPSERSNQRYVEIALRLLD